MSRAAKQKKEHPGSRGIVSRFSRFVFTLLILAAILYAALLSASRTAGFHAIVERRLTDAYPLVWSVGETRLTWKLALTLQDLRARTSADEIDEVFRADSAEIRPAWRPLLRRRLAPARVRVLRPVMLLHRTETGWSPAAFATWAQRIDPAEGLIPSPGPPAASSSRSANAGEERVQWPPYRLTVEEGRFEWRTDRVDSAMTVAGVDLDVRPLQSGARMFSHGTLRADAWHSGGVLHRHYAVEWLALEHRRWILAVEDGM